MIKSYLKIVLRNFKRQKGYSFINISGLAIGLASFLMIMMYVKDEFEYDKFNENAENIQRIYFDARFGGSDLKTPHSPPPLAATFTDEYPDVLLATRIHSNPTGDNVVKYEDRAFNESGFMYADSNVFKVFTFPMLLGNPETALVKPNSVVITESIARKYFGSEYPIGKTLNVDLDTDFQVTGVIADIPGNSHFHFDFLASFNTLEVSRSDRWTSWGYYTYLLLQDGTVAEDLLKRMNGSWMKPSGSESVAGLI